MKPVIIGGGLAGLTVALALAPMPVILLSAHKLGDECASGWAQGGIAAAYAPNSKSKVFWTMILANVDESGGAASKSTVRSGTPKRPPVMGGR